MAIKIYKTGNYIVFDNGVNTPIENLAENTKVTSVETSTGLKYQFIDTLTSSKICEYLLSDITDENGAAYSDFETWKDSNTGTSGGSGGSSGGLTNTELRATPVTIIGSETNGGTPSGKGIMIAARTTGGQIVFLEANASGHLNISDGGGSITIDNSDLSLIQSYFKAEDSQAISGDKGLPLLAMRQLADTTSTDADGDYTLLKIDEEGRVKVATKPASFVLVQSNITANAQTSFCDVSRASNVMISMVAASLVGHNVTFEGSIDSTDGSNGNWFGIQVIRSNANTIETVSGVLAATPAYAWEASVNGLSFVRVRATAHGSGTATWKFQRGSYATEPIPAAQISGTQPVSGTVTANIGTGSIAAGTNAIGDVGLQARGNATGAPTGFSINSPATPIGQIVKAGAGRMFSLQLSNANAASRYLKVFNATSVTMGTTSALFEIEIPPGRIPVSVSIPLAVGLTTGIAIAITGARGLTDNTTITTANEVTGFGTFA
jgi:hypothetical protein